MSVYKVKICLSKTLTPLLPLMIVLIICILSSGCSNNNQQQNGTYRKKLPPIDTMSYSVSNNILHTKNPQKNKITEELNIEWPINVQSEDEILNVALLAPFSGKNQSIGENVSYAAKLALSSMKNDKVRIIAIDTENTDKTTINHLLAELNNYDVDVIVGPVFSEQSSLLQSYMFDKNIPILSLSNDVNLKNKTNLYILGLVPQKQLMHLIQTWRKEIEPLCNDSPNMQYIDKCGYFYAMLPDTHYGIVLNETIEEYSKEDRLIDKKIYRYNPNTENVIDDISESVRDIEKRLMINKACENPANIGLNHGLHSQIALFVSDGDWKVQKIAHQITNSKNLKDCNIYLMGLGNWTDENMENIRDSITINLKNQYYREFEGNFRATYNTIPTSISATAYNAMIAALNGMQYDKETHQWSSQNLTNPWGFLGSYGRFTLHSDGETTYDISISVR